MRFQLKKIRHKILLAFATLIVFTGVIVVISQYYMRKSNEYQSLKTQIKDLLNLSLTVQNYQKNFLLIDAQSVPFYKQKGESKNLSEYNKNALKIKKLISKIEKEPLLDQLKIDKNLQKIRQAHTNYNGLFNSLSLKIQYRGFKDYGLIKKMRNEAHKLEITDSIRQFDINKLRRHEKDFLIRKDLAYANKLYRSNAQLKQTLRNRLDTLTKKDSVLVKKLENYITTANSYERFFAKIVNIEKEIGLTEDEGIRNQLKQIIDDIKIELNILHDTVNERTNNLIWQASLVFLIVILVMLFLSLIVAWYFTQNISAPVELLTRVTKSIASGLQNQEDRLDSIQSQDEVGNLARNFKNLYTQLKSTIQITKEENKKLKEFSQKEAERRWETEGFAIFNEIYRNHFNNLEEQAFEVTAQLVKYTGSSQGGMFVLNDDNEEDLFMELKASYAFNRQKFQKKRVDIGEDLIGTAWREGDTMLLTDVPQSYVHITSGLGQANPNCILIVPIKSDDATVGVIELVSFKIYKEHEVTFIERLSQRIASGIIAIKSSERNKKLLAILETEAQDAQEREARLRKELQNSKYWVHKFEQKLNNLSDELLIYRTVINRLYAGMLITNEKFIITKVNNYIYQRFNYKRGELIGESVDILIETNYQNIIDLREKQFKISYRSFQEQVNGEVIDKRGKNYPVKMLSGKLEIDTKIIYIFLFNEDEIVYPSRPVASNPGKGKSLILN
ncbi:MAG TPA: hypothetical protein DCS93_43385 [Microscillaceae bacterium]|nr:hypothetical protein [Microscillaceae bacterium]